jgi:undecaprenyl-diphosphatase
LTFIDKIIHFDKELFIYLNSLGNENWDAFWILVTNQFSWIPLYFLFLVLIFRAFGWKKGLIFMLFTALTITFSDQLANLVKNTIERARPNNDLGINQYIRILKNPKSYSFYSAHASTSVTITTFLYLTLKPYYRYIGLIFIWPVLFAYSRIYVGVHFPVDIVIGTIVGFFTGWLFYCLTRLFFKKYPVG